jgi:hypothetical protein
MTGTARGRLPTFLVIGAMKAGTTSLWGSLRMHPQVFMPDTKEMHFFSNPSQWERGLPWYCEQFAAAGDARAVGEASTNYTKHPRRSGTAARAAGVIPDARLVYLVRDPIERIRSHYLHLVHGYDERRPLSRVVLDDPELVDVSRYRMQIDQWLEHFDASQLLVLTSEELRDRPADALARVQAFVGVDVAPSTRGPAMVTANRSEEKRVDTPLTKRARHMPGYDALRRITPRPARRAVSRLLKPDVASVGDATMSDALREELADELRDDVAGLRAYLGADFDGWGIA